MTPRARGLLHALVLGIASACGQTDAAEWHCAEHANQIECSCSRDPSALPADASPVARCPADGCCFRRESGDCTCLGDGSGLLTDCSLIQIPGAVPTSRCP